MCFVLCVCVFLLVCCLGYFPLSVEKVSKILCGGIYRELFGSRLLLRNILNCYVCSKKQSLEVCMCGAFSG